MSMGKNVSIFKMPFKIAMGEIWIIVLLGSVKMIIRFFSFISKGHVKLPSARSHPHLPKKAAS